MTRRRTGRESAYASPAWHDTHAVCESPVLSLVPLANHRSILASRYAAAAAGSHFGEVAIGGTACCAATVAPNTVAATAMASLMTRGYPQGPRCGGTNSLGGT